MGPLLNQRHGSKHIPLKLSFEPLKADAGISDASRVKVLLEPLIQSYLTEIH